MPVPRDEYEKLLQFLGEVLAVEERINILELDVKRKNSEEIDSQPDKKKSEEIKLPSC